MNTAERLVAAAGDLFFEHGFSAVGLNQILSAAGIAKTTFYKYFDSLEHLAVTCIERDAEVWRNRVDDAVAGTDPADGVARFEIFLDVFHDWVSGDGYRGCPFIRAITEFPDERDPRHQAGADAMRCVAEQIETLARDAGFAEPNVFARRFQTIMAGTCVLRISQGQAHGDDLLSGLIASAARREPLSVPARTVRPSESSRTSFAN